MVRLALPNGKGSILFLVKYASFLSVVSDVFFIQRAKQIRVIIYIFSERHKVLFGSWQLAVGR